jgi:fido (protein-threonine AMPylation protein)
VTSDNQPVNDQAAREQREGQYLLARLKELYENPLQGNFDLTHLQSIHAYLFQDLPEHRPGIIRERMAEVWVKHRAHEGQAVVYDVPYAKDNIERRLSDALSTFGGLASINGKSPEMVAERLAVLYGDLDYAHGFYEGNSRTLREFMRSLAAEAGYQLDWHKSDVGARERNELYTARDLAVLERAFPGLTPERAMQTDDRAEYEASFVLAGLRRAAGKRTLAAIIRDGLGRLPTENGNR